MKTSSQILLVLAVLPFVHCTADLRTVPEAVDCTDKPAQGANFQLSALDQRRSGVTLLSDAREEHLHDRRYEMALSAVGFAPTRVDITQAASLDVSALRVLVVPHARALELPDALVQAIADEVKLGLCVYTEGESELSKQLGIHFRAEPIEIQHVTDLQHPEIAIQWAAPQPVAKFDAPNMQVHVRGGYDQRAILASGKLGTGSWLAAALPLDEPDGFGYGRLPYFHEALISAFGLTPRLSRPHLIAYLDWGLVYDQDPIEVAERLAERGIREVHLSSWYALHRVRYFFEPFIRACHQRGVLVFSWLELPMVSGDFWDAHPECRERTASGIDAQIDWRKLIALEEPACMQLVKDTLRETLTAFAWDGVDVAELYFESPRGFEQPEYITPFSDWVRADYEGKTGIDPRALFDPAGANYWKRAPEAFRAFLDYRNALCLALNREVIEFVQGLSIGPFGTSPSVMVTLIDTLLDPAIGDYIGIDNKQFMALQAEQHFDINIEDPFTLWAQGPDRYRDIADHYREVVVDGPRLTVDINIVNRGDTNVPHTKQTGLEFLSLLQQSAEALDQTCIYAADTPYPFDFEYAAVALAGKASVEVTGPEQYRVDTPFGVTLLADTTGRETRMDGKLWPCAAPNAVLVPEGQHTVELKSAPAAQRALHITAVNGEIARCAYRGDAVELSYDERRPVIVTLDKHVSRIELDGQASEVPVNETCQAVSVYLPLGKHDVVFHP